MKRFLTGGFRDTYVIDFKRYPVRKIGDNGYKDEGNMPAFGRVAEFDEIKDIRSKIL